MPIGLGARMIVVPLVDMQYSLATILLLGVLGNSPPSHDRAQRLSTNRLQTQRRRSYGYKDCCKNWEYSSDVRLHYGVITLATYLAVNPIFHARTKHIEVDYHFVRERVAHKAPDIRFISTHDQLADILAKPLATPLFMQFRNNLNMGLPRSD
jgi:hypothetical protein